MSVHVDGPVRTAPAHDSVVSRLLVAVVRGYQLVVSPWIAPRCKYYPSCSAYAVTALREHGAVRGTRLAVWRVLRCNPWSLGGVDHVPARSDAPGDGSEPADALRPTGADPATSTD